MAATNSITVNGRTLAFSDGQTILEVCQDAGIFIPTLCHDDRLKPFGGCRLCIVEVHGAPKPLTACTTPATEGMIVETESPRLSKLRKTIIELLLSNHPNDCMVCEAAGSCTLQELAYTYQATGEKYAGETTDLPIRQDNPFITYEPDKCVACGRCVRICNDVVMAGTLTFVNRGFEAIPDTAYARPRTLGTCEFCGQCVSTCPTGALTDTKARGKGRNNELTRVKTTCSYCGTGCNLFLNVKDGKVVKVTSDFDAVVNRGNLCIKGRYGYDFIHSEERLKKPLIREADTYREADWDEALGLIARRFKAIIAEHGPEAAGAFSSSRCTNEENFLLQKWVRTAIGINNVDNCARV